MADADAVASAHLSRYDALLRISKTLSGHKTMAELFAVLADQLHAVVPFDYLALLLHDEPTSEMRLVVLEPPDIMPQFASVPIAEQGPAATVWETQQGSVMVIPEEGPLPPGPEFLRSQGRKVACWLPLTTARRRVGVLAFGSRSPAPYTDDIAAFMAQIAAVVAIAVDNGINWEQAQRYQRDLLDERDACGSCSTSTTCSCHISTTGRCSKRSVKPSSVSSTPTTLAWGCMSGNPVRCGWTLSTTRRAASAGLMSRFPWTDRSWAWPSSEARPRCSSGRSSKPAGGTGRR